MYLLRNRIMYVSDIRKIMKQRKPKKNNFNPVIF